MLKAIIISLMVLGQTFASAASSCETHTVPAGLRDGLIDILRFYQGKTVTKEKRMFDMNDSRSISAADFLAVNQYFLGTLSPGDRQRVTLKIAQIVDTYEGIEVVFAGPFEALLDVNNDGVITHADVSYLHHALQCLGQ